MNMRTISLLAFFPQQRWIFIVSGDLSNRKSQGLKNMVVHSWLPVRRSGTKTSALDISGYETSDTQ
nr:uncharacterized protein CTRU02_11510 [Colletotrichum truncatum]KAF6785885.1 hypothetical protein CTRU02_11510 [Colletotrichum truncatum]